MESWRRIADWWADLRGHRAESDVQPEKHEARTRRGINGEGTYVGRTIGHDDSLDVGETGAEVRGREGRQ